MRRALPIAAVILLALPAARAAASETVVAGPEPNTYQNPHVTIDRGESLFFENADFTAPHDVTSTAGLFRSETVDAPSTVPVRGVAALDPGRFPFNCSIHPWMRGSLTVSGAILGLGVRPGRARTRPGGTTRFRATVRNRGDAATPNAIRVCANAPKGVNVRGKRCRTVPALAVDEAAQVGFRVRATRRASGKTRRVGFTARSPGSGDGRARATLRVR